MAGLKWFLKPAAWLFYFIIVFEILFMISPLALHFYSAYGPALNLLHRGPSTSWLTSFYLPHFSETRLPVLNAIRGIAFKVILAGLILFLAGAIPLYASKILRRDAVTGGLYRFIRHPQYVSLAIVGVGTCLLWPRFLVALSFVTMVYVYSALARWEEGMCLARYGDSYRGYMERTGMFLPRWLERRLPRLPPLKGVKGILGGLALYGAVLAATLGATFALRDLSLSSISAAYGPDAAILSPALLSDGELQGAYRLAAADPRVREALGTSGEGSRIVYVVPLEWRLPDLPMDRDQHRGGHKAPREFDRNLYKVLFTRARTHRPGATGRDIVLSAYGRDPVILAKVDLGTGKVTATEDPPAHVRWGDIPTPLF